MELSNIIKRIFSGPEKKEYNMYSDPGELFYYELYNHYIGKHLQEGASILDIGCQHGRFTIPLAKAGHQLMATDIDDKYFNSIQSELGTRTQSVSFHKENIHATLERCASKKFDVILCLELLYTLKDFPQLLSQLKNLLSPGGLLIASHRSKGYYFDRFTRERKKNELQELQSNTHPYFNAQSAKELLDIYSGASFLVKEQKGIGLLSGIGNDPNSSIANPSHMNESEKIKLFESEIDERNQSRLVDHARYILMIATPSS